MPMAFLEPSRDARSQGKGSPETWKDRHKHRLRDDRIPLERLSVQGSHVTQSQGPAFCGLHLRGSCLILFLET